MVAGVGAAAAEELETRPEVAGMAAAEEDDSGIGAASDDVAGMAAAVEVGTGAGMTVVTGAGAAGADDGPGTPRDAVTGQMVV